MGFLLLGACVVMAFVSALPTAKRHVLLSLEITTEEQLDILTLAAETDAELDFWTYPRFGGYTDIMVPAHRLEQLRQQWLQAGVAPEIRLNDVEEFIQQTEESNRQIRQRSIPTQATTLDHTYYRSYQNFVQDIEILQDTFSDRLVRFDKSGASPPRERTIENRTLHVVEIGARSEFEKPIIMLEVNIHAREWITAAANFYMMDWFLTNYGRDENATFLLDHFDLVIVPVANPDGYEYSRLDSSTRLWRKNRREVQTPLCSDFGVDLNRNFDAFWRASASCRSYTYPGPVGNSEPETRALSKIFCHYEKNMVMYFAVHSYSQAVLLPWAYKSGNVPVDDKHKNMGNMMANAMTQANGLYYWAGTVSHVFGHTAAGSSIDWALSKKRSDSANIHRNDDFMAMSYELRPQPGQGAQGFILDATHIVPTGQELIAGVLTAAAYYCNVGGGSMC